VPIESLDPFGDSGSDDVMTISRRVNANKTFLISTFAGTRFFRSQIDKQLPYCMLLDNTQVLVISASLFRGASQVLRSV